MFFLPPSYPEESRVLTLLVLNSSFIFPPPLISYIYLSCSQPAFKSHPLTPSPAALSPAVPAGSHTAKATDHTR